MGNLNSPEFELAGEHHVELWLIKNGYSNILKESLLPGESMLKASGALENILIRVCTFLHPHNPFKLSEYEVDKLGRKAINMKHIPYAAYVILDEQNGLVGEIIWERLG